MYKPIHKGINYPDIRMLISSKTKSKGDKRKEQKKRSQTEPRKYHAAQLKHVQTGNKANKSKDDFCQTERT